MSTGSGTAFLGVRGNEEGTETPTLCAHCQQRKGPWTVDGGRV